MSDKHTVTYWHDEKKTLGPYTAEFDSADDAKAFAIGVITNDGEVNTDDITVEDAPTAPSADQVAPTAPEAPTADTTPVS